jgi:hypothetical protein
MIHHDIPEQNVQLAFTTLMSGVEDMMDIREGSEPITRELVVDEMSRRMSENLKIRQDKMAMEAYYDKRIKEENASFFNKVEGLDAVAQDAQHAVGGLYLYTSPRLGLARATEVLPVAAD